MCWRCATGRSCSRTRTTWAGSATALRAPVVRAGLASVGASLPRRLPALLEAARASVATLHYSVASAAAIRRAHEVGAAVYVWTVDDVPLAQRLIDAGADGIITNDP